MIISATVLKILGFIDNSSSSISISDTPQEGNLLLALSDSGKKVCLRLTGSKKNITTEDVNNYFRNKTESVIKKKEIDATASELEYVEKYEDLLDEAIEAFKESHEGKPTSAELKTFKKEWKKETAREIVYERRRIKVGSIIRVATSFGDKLNSIIIDNERIPVLDSRCILFDSTGEPSTTGIYYVSQTDNQLPITIRPIFNAKKEPLELFSIALSPLANIGHIELLTAHIYRTFEKSLEQNGKLYVNRISYNFDELKKNKKELEIVSKFNNFVKETDFSRKDDSAVEANVLLAECKVLFEEVVNIMRNNPNAITYIHLPFSVLLTPTYFEKIEPKSPLVKLKDSLVNLNFSNFNPEDKNELKEIVGNEVSELLNGKIDASINAVYSTPGLRLDEEPISWGFMLDNIQQSSFILNSRSTAMLVKKIENYTK